MDSNNEFISIAELTEEMFQESGYQEKGKDSFERIVRKKYAYLMNHVVMRSKMDWRFNNKDVIPLKDAPIIKILLREAIYSPREDYPLIKKWLNGYYDKHTDFEGVIELNDQIYNLIHNESCDEYFEFDDVTENEWLAAIKSATHYERAFANRMLSNKMDALFNATTVLADNIPFGDMIETNQYGSRIYIWKARQKKVNLSQPLSIVLNSCLSQQNYTDTIVKLLQAIIQEAHDKSILFIKAYVELKKRSGYTCADQLLETDSLASEYTMFFQNIYEYLKERPNLVNELEKEFETDHVLDFFKMKNRNGKP